MNTQSKWIMGGILVAVLIVGCTLGAVAVTLMQRTMWGYPPALAANFAYNHPMAPNGIPTQGTMPGPMFGGGLRWDGRPMMQPNNFMGRGPYENFGSHMGRGGYGPGMMGRGDFGSMMDAGGGWGNTFGSLTTIVAAQLDMTTADLTAELQAGKTIADLAKENDVSLDNITAALLAPRLEQMQLMVANGVMTQEQVDAMTTAMEVRVAAQLSSPLSGGPGLGTCPNFDDTDGDGICDHTGRGTGGGWGHGMMWR